nr:hypothetical protein [Actinomadura madurae]
MIMNGWTLSAITRIPLSSPNTIPDSAAAARPSAMLCVSRMTIAPTAPCSATCAPTDRSNPPPAITNVCPNATIARIAIELSTLRMLPLLRNESVENVRTSASTTSSSGTNASSSAGAVLFMGQDLPGVRRGTPSSVRRA